MTGPRANRESLPTRALFRIAATGTGLDRVAALSDSITVGIP